MSVEVTVIPNQIYKANKEDLTTLVSKCQQRSFSEEVDYLEEMGGDHVLEELLAVNFTRGINKSEVGERRRVYGTNEIKEEKPKSFWRLLWMALEDFTLQVLLVAAIVSIVANEIVESDYRSIAWIEGFSIFLAVVICSVVAALNDYQKEKQFVKLKQVAGAKKEVNVWRDNELISIHESQLVVGDVIKITEGMDIPADMLVLEAFSLSADESALTGEPDAIKKRNYNECINKRNEIVMNGEKNSTGPHGVYSPILMSGTNVLNGEGKALVLVVGESSVVGQIRQFLGREVQVTPLQQKLETVARDISKFGLISAILVLVILLVRFLIERGVTHTWSDGHQYLQIIDMVIIAITVLVVAIPEGLPLAVTLSLAYSVKKMMKDNNLVRKLQATETMGGADNVCSDKTGTLTQNKMVLTNVWNDELFEVKVHEKGSLNEIFSEELIETIKQSLACNSSATLKPLSGSKTEIALLEFLENYGEDYSVIRETYAEKNLIKFPFSSQRKRMSVIISDKEDKRLMHIKGASEIVLEACSHSYSIKEKKVVPMTDDLREAIETEITNMANKALRTICIAYKEINEDEDFEAKDEKEVYEVEKNGFTLLGVLGIRDILRKEVKEAIQRCKAAGIKVRMVTGDNKLTAKAIAIECGIIDPKDEKSLILTGQEFTDLTGGIVCKNCKAKVCDCLREKSRKIIDKDRKIRVDTIANPEAFDKIYKHLDVLARSRPEDKYALVTGLMERNCVVAVTGDGTNDAPALKKADIGFAMNSGTDVAKEAADIILLDDNFASIVKAAMWGRNIYDNIRRFLQFQLTVNVVAVLMTVVASAVLQQELLNAVQLLWVNLIMDTLASLALATEPPTMELLNRKPHNRKEYIISKIMMKHIIGQAIYQIAIIMVLTFTADLWVPEYLDHSEIPGYPGEQKYYSDGKHMRSGRPYFITSTGEDYLRFDPIIGPSRHYTMIFNTFVFLQIFNFLNSRKIHDEKNIFKGIFRNPFFVVIVIFITGIQLIIGNLGGRVFEVSPHGMDIRQWLIVLGLSSFCLIWSLMLKLIKFERICPQAGKRETDPIKSPSKILSLKKSQDMPSLQRKYSGLNNEEKKDKSLTLGQNHYVPEQKIM